MRSSHGKITHLHAKAPSGRVVEHSDGSITVGWKDEALEGSHGFLAVTEDGRGAVAIRETHDQAAVDVCDRLGLEKGLIIGRGHSRKDPQSPGSAAR